MRCEPFDDVIAVEGLSKFYGNHRGVEDVSFRVRSGEIVGFLGPNGSGKTTVMRMIMGLIRPTSGRIAAFGEPVRWGDSSYRSAIGYLPGNFGLYQKMRVWDFLSYLAELRGVEVDDVIARYLDRFELEGDVVIGGLSKGNRQKVGVIQALMHRPRVVLLDEPTSGLDPLIQREFESIIAEQRELGVAIVLSSHVMSEVDHLVDRVIILDKGRLVIDEKLSVLKSRLTRTVSFRFPNAVSAGEFESLDGVVEVASIGRDVTCVVSGSVAPVLALAASHEAESVIASEASLEEVFLAQTGAER